MTLREIYTALEGFAQTIPDIKLCIENDVLRLNETREAKYAVFAITQNEHTSEQGWMTYGLNLFYIDRLVNSEDNEVQVQSHAIEILRQILKMAVENGIAVGEARYTAFHQRFQDLCTGAVATATFTVPDSDCVEL